MRLMLAGLAALTLLLSLAPRVADACHPPTCADQIVLPRAGQPMPANATAILLYPRVQWGTVPDKLEVQLEQETASGKLVLSTTVTPRQDGSYEVTPVDGFQPNSSYRLTVPDHCEGSGKLDGTALQHSFTTGDSAALPQQLGTVDVGPITMADTLTVATVSGSCDRETTATHADVHVVLANEARPWASLLVYETRVDGQPFSYSSSLAWDLGPFIESSDKVYTVCSTDDSGVFKGVDPGTHQVTFRATLPGTDLTLETPPLSLTLDCPVPTDDLPPPSDGGLPLPGGDGGQLNGDAVARAGCSVTGRGAGGLPLVLLPLLPLLRRRRG